MKIKVLIRIRKCWINNNTQIDVPTIYLQFPDYYLRLIDIRPEFGILDSKGTLIEYET